MPFFRYKRDEVRSDIECTADNLIRRCHLQIEFCLERFPQSLHVVIAYVSAIFPQMTHDPDSASFFTNAGGFDRIRFGATASIADCGNMVDIDCKLHNDCLQLVCSPVL